MWVKWLVNVKCQITLTHHSGAKRAPPPHAGPHPGSDFYQSKPQTAWTHRAVVAPILLLIYIINITIKGNYDFIIANHKCLPI